MSRHPLDQWADTEAPPLPLWVLITLLALSLAVIACARVGYTREHTTCQQQPHACSIQEGHTP